MPIIIIQIINKLHAHINIINTYINKSSIDSDFLMIHN